MRVLAAPGLIHGELSVPLSKVHSCQTKALVHSKVMEGEGRRLWAERTREHDQPEAPRAAAKLAQDDQITL